MKKTKKQKNDLPQYRKNLKAAAAGGAKATAGRARVFADKKDIQAKDTGDSEIDEGVEEYDDQFAECYYNDKKVCRGAVWTCETCHETFCEHHSHVTDIGNNIECVACEHTRKDEKTMKKFEIRVTRTEVRCLEIEIEAKNVEQAKNAALDKAGNLDFSNGRAYSDTHYDVVDIIIKE